jgi:crossover junction endodeoxyribonuclease RuvC
MRILGIDPGLNTTGYAVLETAARRNEPPRLIEAGVVRGKAGASLAHRVHEIHAGVVDIIESLKPDVLAIEELYAHYERPTTAILMGHARGVIILAAAQASIPVEHYASTQIKKTLTGNGRAAKWQIQEAIRRELGLPQLPEPPDVADALAIALCHCYVGVRVQESGVRD